MSQTSPAPVSGSRRQSATLITGAGGEVGHGLVDGLYAAGRRDLVAIDIRELPESIRSKCQQTVVGDICDGALLGRLMANYEIREIYHLAALLSTRAEFTPEVAHEVNVGGTMSLLHLAAEQARSHGSRVRFLFPSSIAAYGMPSLEVKGKEPPVPEDRFLQPITMYGCNKLYCEQLGRYYATHYRMLAQDSVPNSVDFRSVRFPGLISAETVPSGGTSDFGPEMLHAAAKGESYPCFVRPDAKISFLTMPDAIAAMLQLAAVDEGALGQRVYNLQGFAASAGELLEIVAEHFPDPQIEFVPDPQRQAIVDSWPAEVDDSAARRDWGFAPAHDLKTAFAEYLVPAIRTRYQR